MSTVSIEPLPDYDESRIFAGLRRCLDRIGGMKAFVHAGNRVLLKPNLLAGFSPDRAVTTHPMIIKAVASLVLEEGGRVVIGDSPGVGTMTDVLKKCGVTDALSGMSVEYGDFEHELEFERHSNRVARRIGLAAVLREVDLVITLPKLKTHVQMGFTGALKNQFGFVPGFQKAKYHYRMKNREWLAALMVDINCIVRPALAIMDGIVGMEGAGPSGGNPRHVGALLAGSDITAVDAVACALIDLDPTLLPLMREAAERGFGVCEPDQITKVGAEIRDLRVSDFEKVPELKSILRFVPLPEKLLSWIQYRLAAKPRIASDLCILCGACARGCPVNPSAIDPFASVPVVHDDRCIRCYCCHEFCPVKAIELRRSWLGSLLHT